MMKKTFYIISVLAAALFAGACESEIQSDVEEFSGDSSICFAPQLSSTNIDGGMPATKSSELVSADGSIAVPLCCKVNDGIVSYAPPSIETKGEQKNITGEDKPLGNYSLDKFYVSAWKGENAFVPAYQVVTKGSNVWTTSNTYSWGASEEATFYAYANLPSSGASVANASSANQSLTYTIPVQASAQNDILMGYFKGTGRYDASLHMGGIADVKFYHPLTAVQFKLKPGAIAGATTVSVKKISISSVYAGGSCVMTPPGVGKTAPEFIWTSGSTTTTVTLGNGTSALTIDSSKDYLVGEPFILIPQDLSVKAVKFSVLLTIDGTDTTLEAKMSTGEWRAGKTNTYTLTQDGASYIFSFPDAEDSPTLTTMSFNDNRESEKTHEVEVVSQKIMDDDPDDISPQGWNILSYKVSGGSPVAVSNNSYTDTSNGLTVSKNGNKVVVKAAAHEKVGKGTHEYWTRTNPTEDSGWSPASWAKTQATPTSPVDLSKLDYTKDTYTVLPGMTTANCYVIRHAGTYKLPLVYGNAMYLGNVNEQSYYPAASGNPSSSDTNPEYNYIRESDINGSSIRLVRFENHLGNGITDPFIENNSGCVADNAEILWQSEANVIKNLTLVKANKNSSTNKYDKDHVAYLQFTVDETTICQNMALISVRDAGNNVMWSWQIWTTNDPSLTQGSIEVRNYYNISYRFLPLPSIGYIEGYTYKERKNVEIVLQQEKTNSIITLIIKQPEMKSDGVQALYQFGRKDPTMSKESVYSLSSSLSSAVSTDGPSTGTLAKYIKFPCTFYTFSVAPMVNYGMSLDKPYRNLWTGKSCFTGPADQDNTLIKTVYDPSPIGYKVPAGKAFTGFSLTGDNEYNASSVVDKVNGYFDVDGNMMFYRSQGAGHTMNSGTETIMFPIYDIRAGDTGRIVYGKWGNYYTANVIDNETGKTKSMVLRFSYNSVNGALDRICPSVDSGHNASAVRPVIDPTMPNNPIL